MLVRGTSMEDAIFNMARKQTYSMMLRIAQVGVGPAVTYGKRYGNSGRRLPS